MNRIFVPAMLLLLTSTAFGQIVAPNQVIIFEHNDFVSPCGSFTLTEGRRHKLVPSLGSCNDKVSSILVGEKVLVRVFKDNISSLVVEVVGDEAWQPPARGTASDAQTHRAPTIKPKVGTIITPQQPVKADAQGPAPPAPESATAPGIGQELPASQPFELDTNRPGHDYKNFDLPHPESELCREACLDDPQCRAFTYIKPGVQGPNARCWLKEAVPPAEHAPCCISGVVR